MLPRVLEPEAMDTAEEAEAYDRMDHSTVNRAFASDWLATWMTVRGDAPSCHMIDIGTGTALIPIELCGQSPHVRITAVDLADEMLKRAEVNCRRAGWENRITLQKIDAKGIPYGDGTFDSVVSNTIIHHIPQPRQALAEMYRVLAPGGLLFVRDLYRPESAEEVEHFVRTYAAGETAEQQQLFRQSFHAALTLEEVAKLLEELGISPTAVRMTSDRHWTISTWKS